MNDTLDITNTTNGKHPGLPFGSIKNEVLGSSYELSLVFIGDRRSQTLNRTHRNIDKPASVLSFPLDDISGEIFINLPMTRRRAKEFSMTPTQLVGFLFIHGILHLKGLDHGSTMERREQQLCKRFEIPFSP